MNKVSLQQLPDIPRNKLDNLVQAELDTDASDIKGLKEAMNKANSKGSATQGDIPVLPLVESAHRTYQRRNGGYTGAYEDRLPGGYTYDSCQYSYLNKKFNRIKLFVLVPGWIRVGILRGTGATQADGVARGFFKPNARYDDVDVYPTSLVNGEPDTTADGQSHTMLKKWLVVQWIATPGLHEFDIPDETITSPFEYLYIECRVGEAGFTMNRSGAAVTIKGMSIPHNTILNAQSWPTTFVSPTNLNNGSYAVSNNMLDASAQITYSDSTNAGVVYSSWYNIDIAQDAGINYHKPKVLAGWLNIGLYERGATGNTYLHPVVENCITPSTYLAASSTTTNAISGWGPSYEQQQLLAEKKSRIYGIELIITQPGDLTVFLFSSNDPATCKVINQWTLRTRAIGRQLIHLPQEVVLQPGQWLGVGGCTEAIGFSRPALANCTTSGKFNRGYMDTARFAYEIPSINNWTCKGDDPTGVQTIVPFSSAIEDYTDDSFSYWSGVKYNPDNNEVFDFTNATFNTSNTHYLNVSLICRTGERSKIEDLNVSITGDSITTYRGVVSQTTDFGGITNAAGNNAIYYPDAGAGLVNSVDSTWWGSLIKSQRARLIRNDAWSGSRVSGTDSATSSSACASIIRTEMLHGTQAPYAANTTTGLAHTFGNPEIVFCMIGTNDLSGNVAAGAYSNTIQPVKTLQDISTIIRAFEVMVARHKTNYPHAKLVYFMIPRGTINPLPYTNANGLSIAQLAEQLEYTAKNLGVYFVPFSYFWSINTANENDSRIIWTPTAGYSHPRAGGSAWNGTDRLHPNAIGHFQIASALERFINANF